MYAFDHFEKYHLTHSYALASVATHSRDPLTIDNFNYTARIDYRIQPYSRGQISSSPFDIDNYFNQCLSYNRIKKLCNELLRYYKCAQVKAYPQFVT